jgi:hypothetical protein
MLEYDLNNLDQWVNSLRESLDTWRSFVEMVHPLIAHSSDTSGKANCQIMVSEYVDGITASISTVSEPSEDSFDTLGEALSSSRKRRLRKYRQPLRDTLSSYLTYVNANLILANELSAAFHDWADFLPFYNRKFMAIGKETIDSETQSAPLRELFSVAFPQLSIRNTRQLMKVLNDKRLCELRSLVAGAAAGEVIFDKDFAERTLSELLGIEQTAKKWRNVTSYVTMPIGM